MQPKKILGVLASARRMSGKRTDRGVETGGSGQGTLDGGTGRFSNVRGSCDNEATYSGNKQVLTTVNCSWEQP